MGRGSAVSGDGADNVGVKGQEHRPPPGASAMPRRDLRRITAWELVRLGRELYVAGHLNDEELALLTRQPDLHPAFDRTIGALIGERADPDRRRDAIAAWESRLRFHQSYPDDAAPTKHISHVLTILHAVSGEGGTDRRS
ncbi:MAG: hypothetical protein IPM60_04065 [Rhodospirillales bacterium]|nr:hypothetical protein [Rhodospirillales bacterium]